MKPLKTIPEFASELEERAFWEQHDSTEYVDWAGAKKVSGLNLQPTTETISLSLPEPMLSELKQIAAKDAISYQALIQLFLAEKLSEVAKKRHY